VPTEGAPGEAREGLETPDDVAVVDKAGPEVDAGEDASPAPERPT
jgi:hypothetical protein